MKPESALQNKIQPPPRDYYKGNDKQTWAWQITFLRSSCNLFPIRLSYVGTISLGRNSNRCLAGDWLTLWGVGGVEKHVYTARKLQPAGPRWFLQQPSLWEQVSLPGRAINKPNSASYLPNTQLYKSVCRAHTGEYRNTDCRGMPRRGGGSNGKVMMMVVQKRGRGDKSTHTLWIDTEGKGRERTRGENKLYTSEPGSSILISIFYGLCTVWLKWKERRGTRNWF